MPVFFLSSRNGCLFPFLMLFNLFFGWMIFKPITLWLLIGIGLFLLSTLQSYFNLKSFFSTPKVKSKNIIDIEAEVLKDK